MAVGNAHANVLITGEAVGTLRNNKIVGGKTGHGILLENQGKATIENNDISGHVEPNIEIWGGIHTHTLPVGYVVYAHLVYLTGSSAAGRCGGDVGAE